MKTASSSNPPSSPSRTAGTSWQRRCAAGIVACMGIAAVLASTAAEARGRARIHLGFTFGAPLYWHGWHPAPLYFHAPYYAPRVVVVPSPPEPTVYVERERAEEVGPRTESSGWWYYCRDANAYYPYVKSCPAGWERVAPQPAN